MYSSSGHIQLSKLKDHSWCYSGGSYGECRLCKYYCSVPPEYLEISLDIEAPLHEINRLRARDFIVFLRANNFSELGPDTSLKCKFEIGK